MSGNALIARLADRKREIADTMTGGAYQTWHSVIGLSAECRVLVDVMIVALQWMITGRGTIHAARIGDDFGSFQKKAPSTVWRDRPCLKTHQATAIRAASGPLHSRYSCRPQQCPPQARAQMIQLASPLPLVDGSGHER